MTAPIADNELTTEEFKFEPGDNEKEAHIVPDKNDVTVSMVSGEPITAYCGKVWTPTRSPDAFPVCLMCIENFEKATGGAWKGRR